MPTWLSGLSDDKFLPNLWVNVSQSFEIWDVIDILILTFILYQIGVLTRETRANSVMKGMAIMLLSAMLANLLHLTAISQILNFIVSQGPVVLVVLFQPELRRALEQIGRGTIIDKAIRPGEEGFATDVIVDEMTKALLSMSKRKVGALIVIERRTGLNDILETGTRIDAYISSALIENVFEPNTPLHDGAMVIREDRIAAAGCFLQLTEDLQLSRELGTRHRAAIGITETTDAISLIVSEESGVISVARKGKLTRYFDARMLKELLTGIYGNTRENGLLSQLFRRRNKNE